MKKNGQYVGVDEKYIPDEEKYVDNETNKEIKDAVNDGLNSVKNYLTDEENQKKIKKTGVRVFKIAKGGLILNLILYVLGIAFTIGILVFIIINIAKMNDKTDDTTNQSNSLIDKVTDEMENQINSDEITDQFSKAEINAFNAFFELYSGSQTGLFIETLLNKIVTNNKKEEHIITVVYNDITTAIPDDITTLKENFEDFEEYEVSLDYDTNGFVNKVTIK